MIRPKHPFDIRPDLRKAASTKAESTTAESVIRPKQLVRDNQQRASRDDAKKNIFFLMLNAGHPVCRSPIPFNQIVVDKRY